MTATEDVPVHHLPPVAPVKPTSATLVMRKLTHMFHRFDFDGNGFVEKDDFDAAVKDMAERLRAAPRSPAYTKIRNSYAVLWQQVVLADTNGDGRVSLEEWITSWQDMATADHYDQVIGLAASQLFDCVDTDGNGIIGAGEFSRWLCAHHVSAEVAHDAFGKQDLDGDGMLSKPEVMQNVREFFTSEDAAAPGNWLFGEGF